jgi:hypothetical protein
MQEESAVLYTVVWNGDGPEIIDLHVTNPPDEPYYYLVGRERRHGRIRKGDPEYALSPLEALTYAASRHQRLIDGTDKRIKELRVLRADQVEQLKEVERLRDLEVDRQR